jgi:uncharacterized sulfatase
MHPVELWESDRKIEYPVVQTSLTTRLAEHAVSFITTNRDRPFFLYLPHVAVHKPLAASESLLGRSGHGLYADTLADLDLAVGRALETIKSLGLESRTLVLFTSDNGPWFGGSTGGLRGMKSQSWEGGLRIPLLARLPGVIPAGHVSHQPATNMDLFPTTLALAGIKLPGDRPIDGRDITSLLVSDAPSPHEAIFSMRGDQLATVRAGKWKLHLIPPGPKVEKRFRPDEPWVDKRRPDGVRLIAPFDQAHPSQFPGSMDGPPAAAGLLFDLVADPAEQDDRAREFPEIVQELRQHARDFQARAVP